MKILSINGSPREKGNTGTVLQAMLEVFEKSNWQTSAVSLNKLNINGCQGCMSCKNKTDTCVQKDDMTPIYAAIQDSQAVIMGTPVYLWDVSAQFKLFLDRCFAFWARPFIGRIKPGKTAVLILCQGQPDSAPGRKIAGKYSTFLEEWGFSEVHNLVLPALGSRKDIQKHPEYLEHVRALAEKTILKYGGT